VLPECSGNTQNQPYDGSGSPFGAGASGVLHSTRIFPTPPPEIFGTSTRFFLVLPPFFILGKNQMSFRNLRFNYECDEATLLKLKSLSGKVHIQTKDFQSIISTLINKTYETSKGRKLQ
jgi:hypothetical protein